MGEFNVNKSDGSLEQTAGMPSEYPASQVMMSDGVTSVEDELESSGFDSAIAITSNNLPYTLTKSGLLRITISGSQAAGTYLDVSINSQLMARVMKYNSSDIGCIYTLPLKKGDIITNIANLSNGSVNVFPYI